MQYYNYQDICQYLHSLIPKEEWERLQGTLGEMCREFLGFCDTYYHLSQIIPKDWTVIDFGAGNNPQSYFFTEHKKYIAVNPLSPYKEENGMFCPPNCEIYRMTTGEFLKTVDYPKWKVFAICNYVPNWHCENSMELVRKNFKNCYTFILNEFMKLRELPQEFEKKGVKYTQMKKIVKEYTNEDGEVVKDGIVLYKCLNLEYNDEYFEVFRYRIAKPHPNDTNGWDMVELYPSDEVFGVFAWSCSNVNRLRRMVEKHFEDEYVAEIEKLFVNY